MAILQWNIRGYKPNLIPLTLLITSIAPDIFCLQETKFADNICKYNGYKPYHYINNKNKIACGGTSIFVKLNLPQNEIVLTTTLQAKAVRVTTHRPITICSIYISPDENFSKQQLLDLKSQLPTPFIILGDFNSHSSLWGTQITDTKGKIIEDFLRENDICILNDKSPTYLDPRYYTTTSVDLTFCSPELVSQLKWSVLDNTHDSDHYPIVISSDLPSNTYVPEFFNYKKANWTALSDDCKKKLNSKSEKSFEYFQHTLIPIIEEHIPKSTPKKRKNKCWFNLECQLAIEEKKSPKKSY